MARPSGKNPDEPGRKKSKGLLSKIKTKLGKRKKSDAPKAASASAVPSRVSSKSSVASKHSSKSSGSTAPEAVPGPSRRQLLAAPRLPITANVAKLLPPGVRQRSVKSVGKAMGEGPSGRSHFAAPRLPTTSNVAKLAPPGVRITLKSGRIASGYVEAVAGPSGVSAPECPTRPRAPRLPPVPKIPPKPDTASANRSRSRSPVGKGKGVGKKSKASPKKSSSGH